MLTCVAALVPAMQDRAARHDAEASLPDEDLAALRAAGVLHAPPEALHPLFVLLGRGSLAVGRLIEAHINALHLVRRYGSAEQRHLAQTDAHDGHLFGLWVTDAPGAPLMLGAGVLHGAKAPCSGAGAVTRVLLTAQTGAGSVMAMLPVAGAAVERMPPIAGLRAAAQGRVRFDGVACPPRAIVGDAGDYLREPDLSCGAWRTSAVTLGGLESLMDALRHHLVGRGHHENVLQQERFGRALIARGTARMWVEHAARAAQADGEPVAERVATVNLARIAVETACLDTLRLVQRSAGLAAFVPGPLERIGRDLATYLRQPAPDAVLTEAAAHHLVAP